MTPSPRGEITARFHLPWPGFTLDVDLTLPGHGISALFGRSGSGKTTLLRCIAGLERDPGGRLAVGDELWQDTGHWLPTHRRAIGYVFQEASLFPHLNVLGNLRYGLKRTTAAHRVSLQQAIDLFGIGTLLERKPDRLSGGERSRVAMARALAVAPRLLLMDEPLAALDHQRKQEILPYLERLHDELDIPVLYVSHAPDEVARLADHLVVLDNGRVVANGPLGETLARVDLPIRLGEDAGVVIDAVVAELDPPWHLASVAFPGGRLWLRDNGMAPGRKVRVRILARDVSLAREPQAQSSIQNTLAATITALSDDTHPALTLVRLELGTSGAADRSPVLARITRRAAATLELRPGLRIWAQIKAVALIE